MVVVVVRERLDLLWAPSLYNASGHHLLRVVGNERSEVIDNVAIIAIRALLEAWLRELRLKVGEYNRNGAMIELALKASKVRVRITLPLAFKDDQIRDQTNKKQTADLLELQEKQLEQQRCSALDVLYCECFQCSSTVDDTLCLRSPLRLWSCQPPR